MKIYREQDANMLHLQDQQVAVLGYGNLGRPVALNLRDSSVQTVIGNIQDGYDEDARRDGFDVYSLTEATAKSQIVFIALRDEVLKDTFLDQIAPALSPSTLLIFPSGFNITYGYVEPPTFVEVGMIAPKTLGANVRQAYLSGTGYMAFIALHPRAAPTTLQRLLAVGLAVGALKQGALQVNFEQEVELDLFWQQCLLPALHSLLLTATQLLLEKGYAPESVLTELYLSGELGEFLRQMAHLGLQETLQSLSMTAQYGLLSRTERFQESKMHAHMETILENIRTGQFAQEWTDEYTDGYPRLKRVRDKLSQTALWQQEGLIMQILREG